MKLRGNTRLVRWYSRWLANCFRKKKKKLCLLGSFAWSRSLKQFWGFLGRNLVTYVHISMLGELVVAMILFQLWLHSPLDSQPTLCASTPAQPRAWISIHKPTGTNSLSLNINACTHMLTSPTKNKPRGAYLQIFVFLIVHLMLKYRTSKSKLPIFLPLYCVSIYVYIIVKEN